MPKCKNNRDVKFIMSPETPLFDQSTTEFNINQLPNIGKSRLVLNS